MRHGVIWIDLVWHSMAVSQHVAACRSFQESQPLLATACHGEFFAQLLVAARLRLGGHSQATSHSSRSCSVNLLEVQKLSAEKDRKGVSCFSQALHRIAVPIFRMMFM